MGLKINSILIVLHISLLPVIYSQDKAAISTEQKDWEHLDHMKNFFCKPPEQCNWVHNANMLEYLKYEDKLKTDRSLLAEAFLNKYPNSSYYDKTLSLFLSVYFTPLFIPGHLDRNKSELISQLPRKGSAKAWLQAYRSLPIDFESRDTWLKKGNDYVANIVNSNTTSERKAKVEIWLYNRDIGLALKKFYYLPKEPLESDYWKSFELPYWEPIWNRLLGIMDKYPDSEIVARYIKVILEEFKRFSSELSMTYMKEAIVKSGSDNPLSDRKGFKALHIALLDNLKAMEELKTSPDDKPLEMEFTAMDGSHIDLSDMRGKVVLIDFWSTRCPPCIAAMPHLKVLYDKYKDKGFEILGIADNRDEAKDYVLKILEKTGADWPQRLDRGKEATMSYHSLYSIKSLPTVWLLDKEGKIVDRNARGERLEPLIRKYLELDK